MELTSNNTFKLVFKGRLLTKDNEKNFNRFSRRPYLSTEMRNYEKRVKSEAFDQLMRIGFKEPITCLVSVSIIFYFKDHRRPDMFNAPKSLCDALNKVVWVDDKQIVHGELSVNYSKTDPRTELEIRLLKNL